MPEAMKFSISLGQKMPRMSVYMACRISVNSLGLDGVKERTFSPSQEIVWRLSENVKWMNRLVNIYITNFLPMGHRLQSSALVVAG